MALSNVTLTPQVHPWKPPDLITGCDGIHTSGLKIRVGISNGVDVVPVEYVTLSQMFHLMGGYM